ncbi:MAG: sulfite exporter TauE/SafE family protein [Phycisphaerales bacterium]|nr:sulfite exporter TauE/SafE family protein [Phycisphaerales bacterium]
MTTSGRISMEQGGLSRSRSAVGLGVLCVVLLVIYWITHTYMDEVSISNMEIIWLLVLGFCAGMLGGLIGIGGGVITIPALSLIFGKDIHLAQAASMNVVVFVALPAAYRHWRQGEMSTRLLKYIVPFGIAGIIGGVFVNNLVPSYGMSKIFGAFLIYVIIANILKLTGRIREQHETEAVISIPRGAAIGTPVGFGAGLLGIGGGLITVPLTQSFSRLTLPRAIAISSGLMCFTSVVGAVVKDLTLNDLKGAGGQSLQVLEALQMAAWIFPTAIIGAWIGARLTHALPVNWIRAVFIVVLVVAAVKMLWP